MKTKLLFCIALVLCVAVLIACASKRTASVAPATDFAYVSNADSATVTIRGYTGPGGAVVVPETIQGMPVNGVGDHAFARHPEITSVTIPDSVTRIGDSAFAAVDSYSSITNITLGRGVLSIGRGAFVLCTKLKIITIPASVASIEDLAFNGCFSLTGITVDANNPACCSVDSVLYSKDRARLVQFPGGKAGALVIPDSVTNIVPMALWNRPYLTSVKIPEGITAISQEEFAACRSLATVIVPASVTNIGPNAFNSCMSMRGIYFCGNAPNYGEPWRDGIDKILGGLDTGTIYYVPGTTGWGATFGGRPTVIWKP